MSWRRNILRVCVVLLLAYGALAGADLLISRLFLQNLSQIQSSLSKEQNTRFEFSRASFRLFDGFVIEQPRLSSGTTEVFRADRLVFDLERMRLLKREFVLRSVCLDGAEILSRWDLLQDAITRILSISSGFRLIPADTIHLDITRSRFGGLLSGDIKGYVSWVKEKLLITRGQIFVRKISLPFLEDNDVFVGSSFYKPFDFIFELERDGENWSISRCDVSNAVLKFTGTGQWLNDEGGKRVDFQMNVQNIILDELPRLNNERIQCRGVVEASLVVQGPLSQAKALVNARISNAEVVFMETLVLSKINGAIVISQDHLVGQKISVDVQHWPCVLDISLYQDDLPALEMTLASATRVGDPGSFLLDVRGYLDGEEFYGDLGVKTFYETKDTLNTSEISAQRARLSYDEDWMVRIKELLAQMSVKSKEDDKDPSKEKLFDRRIVLENVKANVWPVENGFVLDHFESDCYGGILEGEVKFLPSQNTFSTKGEAHLKGMELGLLLEGEQQLPGLLSGRVDGDIRFDTTKAEVLRGQLFLSGGRVDQDPVLVAVSDFLGIPSLKSISFDDLVIFFSGGRGQFASEIRLKSADVNADMSARISSYEKIDGYLTVTLATTLLEESKTFRRLLAYIGHDQPMVSFPFKISSYIASPRVMWLKNEFKDKISNFLSERNKRAFQKAVDGVLVKNQSGP